MHVRCSDFNFNKYCYYTSFVAHLSWIPGNRKKSYKPKCLFFAIRTKNMCINIPGRACTHLNTFTHTKRSQTLLFVVLNAQKYEAFC